MFLSEKQVKTCYTKNYSTTMLIHRFCRILYLWIRQNRAFQAKEKAKTAVCRPIPGYKVAVSPEKVALFAILGNFALKIREPIDRVEWKTKPSNEC